MKPENEVRAGIILLVILLTITPILVPPYIPENNSGDIVGIYMERICAWCSAHHGEDIIIDNRSMRVPICDSTESCISCCAIFNNVFKKNIDCELVCLSGASRCRLRPNIMYTFAEIASLTFPLALMLHGAARIVQKRGSRSS